MNKRLLKLFFLCILFTFTSGFFRICFADNVEIKRQIYKIRAYECTEGGERALTGFMVRGEPGIITALHGVVGCKKINALNLIGKPFRDLKIVKADFDLDAALLSSGEIDKFFKSNPDQGLTASNDMTLNIKVIGFPLDVGEHIETENIRIEGIKYLINLIPTSERDAFAACMSPSPSKRVYSLEGTIRPGESGAPVLNDRDQVIGIGMGGLDKGRSSIVWASRWKDLDLVDASDSELKALLAKRSQKYCPTNRFAEVSKDVSGQSIQSVRIKADQTKGPRPLEVNFSVEASGQFTFYQWDFGDGRKSKKRNLIHVYPKTGLYHVKLTAGGNGVEVTDEILVSTIAVPRSSFRLTLGVSQGSLKVDKYGRFPELEKLKDAFDDWDTGNNHFSYNIQPTTASGKIPSFLAGKFNLYLAHKSELSRLGKYLKPWDRLINLEMYEKSNLLTVKGSSGEMKTIGIPYKDKYFVIPSSVSGQTLEGIISYIAYLTIQSEK
jgi:hypothetical protein